MSNATSGRACAPIFFAFLAALGPVGPVWAQSATDNRAKGEDAPLEITVLGHRQAISETGASVVAIEPSLIEDRRVQTIDDLAPLVPGLFVINDQDPGTNIINIRGVTTDRLQQPAIAYVLNGVPLGDTEFFTQPLFDVERIEVARGPQGAGFGKNASAGTLSVRTRDPSLERFDGYARAALGNGGFYEGEAAFGGPIGGGFGLRVAGQYRTSNGLIRNDFLGRRVDFFSNGALRATLSKALGRWNLAARVQFIDESGGAAYISSNNVEGLFGGRLAGTALTNPIGDFLGSADRKWGHYAFEAERKGDKAELSLHYAHDDYKKNFAEELDFRNGPVTFFGDPIFPDGIQPVRQPVNLDVETVEIRAESPHASLGRLSWRVGAFVQDVDRVRVDDFGPLQFGAPAPRFDDHSTQFGLFGGLDFAVLADRSLVLSADLRYDRDARGETIVSTDNGALIDRRRADFGRAQPRLSFAWRPAGVETGAPLFYLTYGEAFRTGGFNPLPGPSDIFNAAFAPEVARSLEGGYRAHAVGFDLDFAVYGTKVANYQNFTFLNGLSITLSVDRVRIWGTEVSIRSPEIQGFRLESAFALVNAKIVRFVSPDPIVAGAERDSSGHRVPNVPQLTGTFGGVYHHTLGRGQIRVRADANLIGRTAFELDNVLFTPVRADLDLRAEYRIGRIDLALWSKNATNARSAISAFGQNQLPLLLGLGPNGPFDSFTLSRPRSFGGEAMIRY